MFSIRIISIYVKNVLSKQYMTYFGDNITGFYLPIYLSEWIYKRMRVRAETQTQGIFLTEDVDENTGTHENIHTHSNSSTNGESGNTDTCENTHTAHLTE